MKRSPACHKLDPLIKMQIVAVLRVLEFNTKRLEHELREVKLEDVIGYEKRILNAA